MHGQVQLNRIKSCCSLHSKVAFNSLDQFCCECGSLVAAAMPTHTHTAISIARQEFNLNLLTLREMNFRDHTEFFRFILLLSGNINLNPGHTQISKTWSVFKKRGLHFVHLNINSLPFKIEELKQIAKDTNSAVIGLSETKLDKTTFDSEISIPNYSLIRKGRNRKVFALIAKISYLTKLKIFLLTCYSQKQSLFLLPVYINHQLIITSQTTYLGDSLSMILI